MATPMRMKEKLMNKIHLDANGQQVISVVPAASDAPSKGVSAQPANPLTPQETSGLPGGTSVKESVMGNETGTGAPLERVAPEGTTDHLPADPPVASAEGTAQAEPTPAEPEAEKAPVAEDTAPVPPGPGDPAPAAVALSAAQDPNSQKETTTPEQPNTGEGKIVGETDSAPVALSAPEEVNA